MSFESRKFVRKKVKESKFTTKNVIHLSEKLVHLHVLKSYLCL